VRVPYFSDDLSEFATGKPRKSRDADISLFRRMCLEHGSIPRMSGTSGGSVLFSEQRHDWRHLVGHMDRGDLMKLATRFLLPAVVLAAGQFAVAPAFA
jgi:hypothetical protein